MNIKTYSTILTEICDFFDSLITPKKITRSNSNVIYLMFKAIAKGFEVVNNVCVALSNKFIPESCEAEDLDSVGALVGTVRKKGNGTGLRIVCINTNNYAETLLQGSYSYKTDDATFVFTLLQDVEIVANGSKNFLAMTEVIGSYPVEAQSDLVIESTVEIPTGLNWNCLDNSNLLGGKAETDEEFRKRIVTDTSRQNAIVELEAALRSLPYILDCKIKFNSEITSITYDGLTVPPFSMAIFASGDIRNSLAEIVASYVMIPTVYDTDAIVTYFQNTAFVSGQYPVYFIPFKPIAYSVQVTFRYDAVYTSEAECKSIITSKLLTALNTELHLDTLREKDIYAILNNIDITGCEILGCNIIYNGEEVDYIDIPVSRVPNLTNVTYVTESM